MGRAVLDPRKPRRLTAATRRRLDSMSDQELTVNALRDPDNPPLTDDELARIASARRAQAARSATGLSQAAFAARFGLSLGTVRDWEQGRSRPDAAAQALLTIISREPEAATRAIAAE